jgi:hypothetical protein
VPGDFFRDEHTSPKLTGRASEHSIRNGTYFVVCWRLAEEKYPHFRPAIVQLKHTIRRRWRLQHHFGTGPFETYSRIS